MANIYKNAKLSLTNTNVTTLYTAPTNNTSIIKSIIVNEKSNNASTLSLILYDGDPASGNPFNLYTTKPITALQTLELLDKPLVVKSGEVLQVTAGHANRLMLTASLLEIS